MLVRSKPILSRVTNHSTYSLNIDTILGALIPLLFLLLLEYFLFKMVLL
jgi:hypothetical protein